MYRDTVNASNVVVVVSTTDSLLVAQSVQPQTENVLNYVVCFQNGTQTILQTGLDKAVAEEKKNIQPFCQS